MSPFATLLLELRLRHGLRQSELAELMGYEQAYISGVEIGTKGVPTSEFIEKLVVALALQPEEQDRVREAALTSNRKLAIAPDAPEALFLLLAELREFLSDPHPDYVRLIRDVLRLRQTLTVEPPASVQRIRRRKSED